MGSCLSCDGRECSRVFEIVGDGVYSRRLQLCFDGVGEYWLAFHCIQGRTRYVKVYVDRVGDKIVNVAGVVNLYSGDPVSESSEWVIPRRGYIIKEIPATHEPAE